MWICEKCGRVLDELDSWKEDRGECFGFSAYETVWGCKCGSTDVFYLYDDLLGEDKENEQAAD